MIVMQKRSGKRHLIHPDGLATRCGRRFRRGGWSPPQEGRADCRACLENLRAFLLGRSSWR